MSSSSPARAISGGVTLAAGPAALGAYLLVALAIMRSGGSRDLLSVVLLLAALGLALAGVVIGRAEATPRFLAFWLPRLLGGLVGVELLWLALRPESAFLSRGELHLPVVGAAGLMALVTLSYFRLGMLSARLRLPMLLTIFLLLGAWLIWNAPEPGVDVWHFQQRAGELLLQGENPYAGEYPNPYDHTRFMGERLLKDGKVQSFPYPPLSLVLVLPGYALGDVRWIILAAMAASAALLAATGRRLGLAAGHPAELAAVALLASPWNVLMIEAGWTEPLLAMAICAGVWAIAAGYARCLTLTLAAMLAIKQYGFLLLPAFMASGALRGRQIIVAAFLAGTTIVPFLLWDPESFRRGMIDFHVHNVFRDDSLSLPAVIAVTTGCQLPGWLGLLTACIVAAVVIRGGPPSLATAALGGAAILLAFFLFNRGAHLNYYWPVLALLGLGVICTTAEVSGNAARGEGGSGYGHEGEPRREPRPAAPGVSPSVH